MSSTLLQMALLRWLTSQTEEDRNILTAVMGVQVGRELLNRVTGQGTVDAYKVPGFCLQGTLCLQEVQITEVVEGHKTVSH